MKAKYDLLAVGELLIDLIGTQPATDLAATTTFQKFQGGSPANLGLNMARLGNRVALVSSVGQDSLGDFLQNCVRNIDVDSSHVQQIEGQPTTIVVVARTTGTPDFQAYRGADAHILPEHLPNELLQSCKIFHTTCFALSCQPAQNSIVEAAQRAFEMGVQVSIDLNYSPKIWPNRAEAQHIIEKYCANEALAKLSEDDWERIYPDVTPTPEYVIAHFLNLGAKVICYTLGSKGCWVANQTEKHFIQPKAVQVVDSTGAGDAFWSGFLTAYLNDCDLATCGKAGANMAAIKLQHLGPLKENVAKANLWV